MHPWAWWAWALGVAAAVSMTTNPLLLALIALGLIAVILLRRTDAPWARSVAAYFVLAGVIIGIRLFFQVLLGGSVGGTVILTLPEIRLPAWAAGIRLGGAVTAEGLAWAVYDALRLSVMLLCLGAANSLANPRQALRSVPAALYEASVAVVIALSVAPQLVESTQRVRRARRLRGGTSSGLGTVTAVVIPVLADAIDRSLRLAAGMEARGFGRSRTGQGTSAALTAMLAAAALAATVGVFLLLGAPEFTAAGAGMLLAGILGTVLGLRRSGRALGVTRYRPQPWTGRDTLLAVCGATAAAAPALATASGRPALFDAFNPSVNPLVWPTLHGVMIPVVAMVLAPLAVTSPPGASSRRVS